MPENGHDLCTEKGVKEFFLSCGGTREASHLMEGYFGYKRNYNPEMLAWELGVINKSRQACCVQVCVQCLVVAIKAWQQLRHSIGIRPAMDGNSSPVLVSVCCM